MSKVRQYWS